MDWRNITPRAGGLVPDCFPAESPVFLPMSQVQPSPTTGMLNLIPPLFHGAGPRVHQRAVPASLPEKHAPAPETRKREAAKDRSQMNSATVALADASSQDADYEPGTTGQHREHPYRHGKLSVANSDGWQWRKYGEKIVKGNPNPRSYYKCSDASCKAKKIVERGAGGDIISTQYKEEHKHPAPSSVKAPRFKPRQQRQTATTIKEEPLPVSRRSGSAASLMPPPSTTGFALMGLCGQYSPIIVVNVAPTHTGGRGSTKRWEEEDDEDDDSELQQFAAPEQRQQKLGGHSETSSLHHEDDEESQGRGGGYTSGSEYLPVKRHCQESACSVLEIGELDTGGRGSPMSRPTPEASAIGKKWLAMVGSPTTRLDALAAYAGELSFGLCSSASTPEGNPSRGCRTTDTAHPHSLITSTAKSLSGTLGEAEIGTACRAPTGVDEDEKDDESGMADAPDAAALNSATSTQTLVSQYELEDGFKWRKYGQKHVRRSPHPRSYYKCTFKNCPVKKHVERHATIANKLVVTVEGLTADGLHTHNFSEEGPLRFPSLQMSGEDDTCGGMEVDDEHCNGSGSGLAPGGVGLVDSGSQPSSPGVQQQSHEQQLPSQHHLQLQPTLQQVQAMLAPYLPNNLPLFSTSVKSEPDRTAAASSTFLQFGLNSLAPALNEFPMQARSDHLNDSTWDPRTCLGPNLMSPAHYHHLSESPILPFLPILKNIPAAAALQHQPHHVLGAIAPLSVHDGNVARTTLHL